MTAFKALLVSEENGVFLPKVVERSVADLPAGEVLIRVQYSSLNYKDALSASGNRGVTKAYPHTPGIDAAGVVAESSASEFTAGDEVIVPSPAWPNSRLATRRSPSSPRHSRKASTGTKRKGARRSARCAARGSRACRGRRTAGSPRSSPAWRARWPPDRCRCKSRGSPRPPAVCAPAHDTSTARLRRSRRERCWKCGRRCAGL